MGSVARAHQANGAGPFVARGKVRCAYVRGALDYVSTRLRYHRYRLRPLPYPFPGRWPPIAPMIPPHRRATLCCRAAPSSAPLP